MIKPRWARQVLKARRLEEQAQDMRRDALTLRCPERDSGGEQCTLDAQPAHNHRVDAEDLP